MRQRRAHQQQQARVHVGTAPNRATCKSWPEFKTLKAENIVPVRAVVVHGKPPVIGWFATLALKEDAGLPQSNDPERAELSCGSKLRIDFYNPDTNCYNPDIGEYGGML